MRKNLDRLYNQYNQRAYVHPDPLEFLYLYQEIQDREIAGLIASALAYGKVAQILKSVGAVLEKMGPSPFAYLGSTPAVRIVSDFQSFVHRFAKGPQLSAFLIGIKQVLREYGSLHGCFLDGFSRTEETILPALSRFSETIIYGSLSKSYSCSPGHLMPCPEKGSACKRLNLFLRWMVRKDAVDPGGWDDIPRSMLIIPLDTHMFRVGKTLGLTSRNQADLMAALDISAGFKQWSPDDPVKYDFALTRFGIRDDLEGHHALLKQLGM
ncbi:MAG: TIGR02757 family protein [Desulfobacteraceae bacterium]|nr:MAG: TIGR02757 family protein [Desulfobacteraceae bacterium]